MQHSIRVNNFWLLGRKQNYFNNENKANYGTHILVHTYVETHRHTYKQSNKHECTYTQKHVHIHIKHPYTHQETIKLQPHSHIGTPNTHTNIERDTHVNIYIPQVGIYLF